MVTPAADSVVVMPFSFSDLSRATLRLAVVLADAGRGDWILCQARKDSRVHQRCRSPALEKNNGAKRAIPWLLAGSSTCHPPPKDRP